MYVLQLAGGLPAKAPATTLLTSSNPKSSLACTECSCHPCFPRWCAVLLLRRLHRRAVVPRATHGLHAGGQGVLYVWLLGDVQLRCYFHLDFVGHTAGLWCPGQRMGFTMAGKVRTGSDIGVRSPKYFCWVRRVVVRSWFSHGCGWVRTVVPRAAHGLHTGGQGAHRF